MKARLILDVRSWICLNVTAIVGCNNATDVLNTGKVSSEDFSPENCVIINKVLDQA